MEETKCDGGKPPYDPLLRDECSDILKNRRFRWMSADMQRMYKSLPNFIKFPELYKHKPMEKTESQNKQILKHLQSGRTLTAYEALKVFGCFRLASRINDLRNQNHAITTKYISENGKRFAEYGMQK